ncbi:MAG TPA: hypothetical protein VF607_16470, partial [Verrucomicrobiae bacterium]
MLLKNLFHKVLTGLALSAGLTASAQNLTATNAFLPIAGFYPQYDGNGNTTRLPFIYRATLSNLSANTTYRYYTGAGTNSDLGAANVGAGNPVLVKADGSVITYATS